VGGVCIHNANNLQCPFSTGCITGGICINKECTPNSFSPCSTENVGDCESAVCDRVTGACVTSPITDGITSCETGDACYPDGVCTPNGCVGSPLTCPTSTIDCQEYHCVNGECVLRNNDDLSCNSRDTECTTSICQNGVCVNNPDGFIDCSDTDICTYGNTCTQDGCVSTPYSCILSPCIYSTCTDDGFCRFDNALNTWNPLTYIAFRTTTKSPPTQIRYYIVAVSSLTGDIRGFVRVSDRVISLQVKPFEGGLYAVTNNGTASSYLYRIPVDPTAVNVFEAGVQAGWPFITRIGSAQNTLGFPDLSFKPTFQSVDQPHTYSLWARSRQSAKAYSLNTSTNPAGQSQQYGSTFNGWTGFTWDNHGRFIFGANAARELLLFNHKEYDPISPVPGQGVYQLCSADPVIPTGTLVDMFTRYDESIIGATDDLVNNNINIFSIRFDNNADGLATCFTSNAAINKTSLVDPLYPESLIEVQAVAFDDTICLSAVGGPDSNGGNVTNTGGVPGSTSHNGGGGSPPPVGSPPPDQVIHYQGGSSPGAHTPGTTDNGVLTGGTGSVATAVVSIIGSSAVAAFAVFAVVLGLNNTKKDPPQNLTAALVSTDASAIASDNPLFQGLNEAGTNVLA